MVIMVEKAGEVPAGMYIRLTYTSTGLVAVKVLANFLRYC